MCQSQSCAPSRSLTASTRSSTGSLQVCCALLPVMGFIVFRASDPHRSCRSRCRVDPDRPHGAFRTPRRIPLVGSRTASLRPLPPRRSLTAPSPCAAPSRIEFAGHTARRHHTWHHLHTPERPKAFGVYSLTPRLRCLTVGRSPRCHTVTRDDESPSAVDTGRSPCPLTSPPPRKRGPEPTELTQIPKHLGLRTEPKLPSIRRAGGRT
jgi:hypothetical protein